jgi:intraflagellar transport protein 52
VVFGGPTEKFRENEVTKLQQKALTETKIKALKGYLDKGGSILYFSGEGGDDATGTNFNYFLEAYGIEVNTDAVIRSAYMKYPHPKVLHSVLC